MKSPILYRSTQKELFSSNLRQNILSVKMKFNTISSIRGTTKNFIFSFFQTTNCARKKKKKRGQNRKQKIINFVKRVQKSIYISLRDCKNANYIERLQKINEFAQKCKFCQKIASFMKK